MGSSSRVERTQSTFLTLLGMAALLLFAGCAVALPHAATNATATPQPTATVAPTATPRPPTLHEMPVADPIFGLVATSDGHVWYGHGSALSSFNADGTPGPQVRLNGYVQSVVLGPGGRPWAVVRGSSGTSVVQVTSHGTMSYPVAAGYEVDSSYVTTGPDGALWYLAHSLLLIDRQGQGHTSSVLVRVSSSGQITQYPYPRANTIGRDFFGPANAAFAVGPDHRLWMVMVQETCTQQPTVVSCNDVGSQIAAVSMSGAVQVYAPPGGQGMSADSIIAGTGGNLWVSISSKTSRAIATLSTSGQFRVLPLPSTTGGAAGMVSAPDGSIWFTTTDGSAIGNVSAAGVVSEQTTPSHVVRGTLPQDVTLPNSIVVGPGGVLWFTERLYDYLGYLRPGAATIAEIALPDSATYPLSVEGSLIAGPGDRLWYTRDFYKADTGYPTAGAVGFITP
ncbi:MAG: hypothetical protein ACHQ4H_09520 [Ktedonobacterales bacterium]